MHLPLLVSPLGWVVLGATGYLLYKAGKNSGKKEVEKKTETKKA